MSVMEMSHRGKDFISILHKAERDLRQLLYGWLLKHVVIVGMANNGLCQMQ